MEKYDQQSGVSWARECFSHFPPDGKQQKSGNLRIKSFFHFFFLFAKRGNAALEINFFNWQPKSKLKEPFLGGLQKKVERKAFCARLADEGRLICKIAIWIMSQSSSSSTNWIRCWRSRWRLLAEIANRVEGQEGTIHYWIINHRKNICVEKQIFLLGSCQRVASFFCLAVLVCQPFSHCFNFHFVVIILTNCEQTVDESSRFPHF